MWIKREKYFKKIAWIALVIIWFYFTWHDTGNNESYFSNPLIYIGIYGFIWLAIKLAVAKERKAENVKREAARHIAEDKRLAEEEARLARLTKLYGEEITKKILSKNVWQGMSVAMLIESLGNPGDIDETVYKTKTTKKYSYLPYRTRQNNTRYKFRVDLEDDIVVGWRDMDQTKT